MMEEGVWEFLGSLIINCAGLFLSDAPPSDGAMTLGKKCGMMCLFQQ
jgi:hypothetical protein